MFFIRIGSIIAWVAVVAGGFQIGAGFLIALLSDTTEQRIAFARRYLVAGDSGAALTQGMLVFVVGIVIGLLVQIAKNTRT